MEFRHIGLGISAKRCLTWINWNQLNKVKSCVLCQRQKLLDIILILTLWLVSDVLEICRGELRIVKVLLVQPWIVNIAERKSDKCRLYNFSRIKKTRKWLKVGHFAVGF